MMINDAVQNLTSVLKMMAKFELTLAYFYRTCGQTWAEAKGFWTVMEKAEIKHAAYLKTVSKIFSEKPERFTLGRHFKPAALKTSMSGIEWNIERLRNREVTRKNMLFISRDIEHSLLEGNYGEIIQSSDVESRALMDEILSDTEAHQYDLDRKIVEVIAKAEARKSSRQPSWGAGRPPFWISSF